MRKEDPSSRRSRRRKPKAVLPQPLAEIIDLAPLTRRAVEPQADFDCDFGVALCLGSSLRGKRLPEA